MYETSIFDKFLSSLVLCVWFSDQEVVSSNQITFKMLFYLQESMVISDGFPPMLANRFQISTIINPRGKLFHHTS